MVIAGAGGRSILADELRCFVDVRGFLGLGASRSSSTSSSASPLASSTSSLFSFTPSLVLSFVLPLRVTILVLGRFPEGRLGSQASETSRVFSMTKVIALLECEHREAILRIKYRGEQSGVLATTP